MEGSVSAPPQRVCPKCARISWATGPRCPYCRARFRSQSVAVFAWMLTAAVVVMLAGMFVIFLLVANRVQDHVDTQVNRIDQQIEQIRREVDQRLPAAGAVPTVTPVPTAAPTAAPTASAAPTATPTPTASATATATNTPASDNSSTTDPSRTETRP